MVKQQWFTPERDQESPGACSIMVKFAATFASSADLMPPQPRGALPASTPADLAVSSRHDSRDRRGLQVYGGVSALALLAAGLATAPAEAACTISGTTMTCTDDVSAGATIPQNAIDRLVVEATTTTFGGRSVFLFNANDDITIDADFDDFGLDNDPTTGRTTRMGFHVLAEGGSLDVDLAGTMTIQAGSDESLNTNTIIHDHTGGIVFHALGDLTFDQTGDVVINHANLTANSTFVASTDIDEFRGLHLISLAAESASADITVNRSGSLEINAGDLASYATDADGSNRTIAGFSNGVLSRELYGVYAQGGGDFDFTNDGDITLNTGIRLAESSSVGGRAESNAAMPFGAVIGMTRAVDGVSILQKTEQQFNNVTIRQTGDVIANVETIEVSALAETQIGGDPAEAAVRLNSSFYPAFHGVLIESGLNVDAEFDGNITIDGGMSIATVNALAGPDPTSGLVTANVNGADVYGFSGRVIGDFTEGDTLNDSMASLLITGDVSVAGGSATSTIAGSGLAPEPIQTFPPPAGGTPTSISQTGGFATGIYIADFADEKTVSVCGTSCRTIDLVNRISIGLGGDVSAQGGDVDAALSGGNLIGSFSGGAAIALSTSTSSITLDTAPDTSFIASGGAVDVTLTGSHDFIRASGGFAQGVVAELQSDTDVAFEAGVVATGGAVTITGDTGEGEAFGGGALGAQLILDDRYFSSEYAALPDNIKDELAARQILVIGDIIATGGEATALDPDVMAFGGDAIGLRANTATVLGTVTATAGNGTTRRGAVAGVEFENGFRPGLVPLDIVYATVRIGGEVEVYGEGVDIANSNSGYRSNSGSSDGRDTTESMSAGIRLSGLGNQGVDVLDGGLVSAHGNYVHGIAVANEKSTIHLASGSMTITDGANAAGIEVRPYFVPAFSDGDAQGSIADITIENGASLISQQGIAIHDEERVASAPDRDGPIVIETYDNQTSVDIAGVVTGGNGTAIDLGTGADAVMLRSTATVNGAVLLGAGADRFAFEDGYAFTQVVDGGDDEDIVVAEIETGDSRTVDVANLSVTGFEVIEKLGGGTLTLAGDPLTDAWRLDARGGLTTVGTGYGTLDAMVFDGAEVRSDAALGDVVTSGTGRLSGNVTVAGLVNNGVVAPGNSIGTITVTGDANFNAGSVYEVEIEAPDQSDLIAVAGTATIDGGALEIVTLSPEQSYVGGQTYRIIEAGDVVVASGFVFDEPFSLLTTEVIYGDGFVDLLLAASTPLQDFAETPNQRAAASGLNDLDQSGDALAVFNELYMLDPVEAPSAFDLTSGEVHASARHLVRGGVDLFTSTLRRRAMDGLVMDGLNDGTSTGMPLALGYADEARPSSPFDSIADRRIPAAWGGLVGTAGDFDGNGNAAAMDFHVGGIVAGYQTGGALGGGRYVAGFGAGYMAGEANVMARMSGADTKSAEFGVYGGWSDGRWTVTGAAAFAATQVSTQRRIVFGAIDRTADADYWTRSVAISTEASRAFDLGGFQVAPLFTLNAGRSGHGGATETGAGALNLMIASDGWGWFDTGLGVDMSRRFEMSGGYRIEASARAVWEHAFAGTTPDQTMAFAASPTAFTVHGPAAGRDRLRLGFDLDLALGDRTSLNAGYDGLFSSGGGSHSGRVGLRVEF